MKFQKGFAISELLTAILYIGIFVGAVGGYILNIVKLIGMVDGPVNGMLIVRAIGIVFMPLGVIVGWL